MANGFVPEGQADRSQARSAWVAMQRAPRPGGTAEVIVRLIPERIPAFKSDLQLSDN
jgi:hypothetical protein